MVLASLITLGLRAIVIDTFSGLIFLSNGLWVVDWRRKKALPTIARGTFLAA